MTARVIRPMPKGSVECSSCAGTGEPSPWEHDYHIWLRGEPIAVCGACRGAGKLSKWGFRLSAGKVLNLYRRANRILRGWPATN